VTRLRAATLGALVGALLGLACRPTQPVKDAEVVGLEVACVAAALEGATPAELDACAIARAAVSAQPVASMPIRFSPTLPTNRKE
jgi:hypothetical protein